VSGEEGAALVDVMGATFCGVKILEYSLRGVLTEMVGGLSTSVLQVLPDSSLHVLTLIQIASRAFFNSFTGLRITGL